MSPPEPADRMSGTEVTAGYGEQTARDGLPAVHDEMLDREQGVRSPWREVGAALDRLGVAGLRERRDTIERLLEDDGATYRAHGSQADQPWALDPIPMLLDEAQWAALEPALVQRAELLDLIVTDIYGPRTLIARGLLPPEVVFGHVGFVRQADQIRLPGPRQLFLVAPDLARDSSGQWKVLSDRTQAPSGAGYAMENRRVVSRAMPGLHRSKQVHLLGPFFHAMRLALQQLSPTSHEAPRVVLLTPGARSETAFDQAFLSSLLGFPLVEGSDLTVRDGRVWQRSISRLEPVDVILRRVDSWFCDPLELRPDSQLGVPGLLEAARLGTVSVVNGVGSGVLENPTMFPFLPAICEALLDEPLRLHSAQTWWCGDHASRQHVLANLDQLVVKPASRLISRSSRFGWEMSAAGRDELARRIESEPHAWVAQERLELSTAPTVVSSGLEPRPVVLRTFAVAQGGSYRVMSGGLVRAASRPDSLLVSNQDGAISKDVWVITGGAGAARREVMPWDSVTERVTSVVSPRVAEDLFWLGRYAERAEATARLLRITDNRWHDVDPAADPALARCLVVLLESLTAVTTTWPGFLGEGAGARLAKPRDELLSLIGADARIGTLAHCIRRMRELATDVRDQMSNDTWLVLSGLDRGLAPFNDTAGRGWAAADDVSAALGQLLESLLAFSGIAAESMVRDAGWYFMDAGRRIERALQVTDLVRACLVSVHPPEVDDLVMESVLIAAESIITHRRRYSARAGVDTVLELLLVDRGNPRSVAHQVDRLAVALGQMPAGSEDESIHRRLLDVAAGLQETGTATLAGQEGDRRPHLDEALGDLGGELRGLATVIESAHFVQPAPLHPLEPFGVLEEAS